jgi:hypothetical protein
MIDFKALGAKAAAEGADQTKTTAGGGDYEPPAAGPCRLRFVAYIELGKQKGTFQGKPNVKEKVQLTFELSGPKHQPKVMDDGTKLPHRITITENLSLNEKARFKKLFGVLNYKGDAQHMVQLLGEAYKGVVIHRTFKGKDGKDRTVAELFDKAAGAFTIAPPRYEEVHPEDGPTGNWLPLKVEPAITPLKAFMWQYADKEMWDSIFIEGEYPERKDDAGKVTAPAKSKNVLQNTIKQATNFVGSPIYVALAAAGASLDIPDAEQGMALDEEEEGEDAGKSSAAAGRGTGAPSTGSAPAAGAASPATPQGAAATDALNDIV